MKTRRSIGWLLVSLLLGGAAVLIFGGPSSTDVGTEIAAAKRDQTVLSPVYTVDAKYRSMMGPSSHQEIRLGDGEDTELVWITGYRARMVAADGQQAMPQEFMCHSNLDLDIEAHAKALGKSRNFGSRLFTLSQGQFSVQFPDGFGIPVLSDEALSLTTQVLNLNSDQVPFDVRHRVTVEYVREDEVGVRMKALFPTAAYGLALIEGDNAYFGVRQPDQEDHGPGCLVGENASDHEYNDGMGRRFTGHWVVKPGREVNRTLVSRLMQIPYETRIHYIAVHLHPFAESLELRDLTTDETLFVSSARNFEDRIGLAHVDAFSSPEGIPVYSDHEYEIVSTYNNTTDEDQDSMAVMYIYLRDLEFERKRPAGRWRVGARKVGARGASKQPAAALSES